MDIALSPETRQLIEERMRHGGYATPEAVVRAGLDSLDLQDSLADFAPGELDRLIRVGEQSGEPLEGEAVFAELRALRDAAERRG